MEQIKDKCIGDMTINEIFFSLKLYRPVELDYSYDSFTNSEIIEDIKNEVYDENGERIEIPFVYDFIEATLNSDVVSLLEFIQGKYSIYGNCPNCKLPTFMQTNKMEEIIEIPLKLGEINLPTFDDWQDEHIVRKNDKIMHKICEKYKLFNKSFSCPHCKKDFYAIFSLSKAKGEKRLILQKVGQYPSIQKFDIKYNVFTKNIKKFDGYEDYKNAIGCYCSGYVVGAYAYIRRVVEKYVKKAYKDSVNNGTCDLSEEEFNSKHFDEKIKAVSTELHDLLSNKNIYNITSAGVHVLTDEQCDEGYSVLINAIESIINSDIEKKIKNDKEQTLKKDVQKLNNRVDNLIND